MKYASAYVVMPGGFGTLDELFEALTLIQTRMGRAMPLILVGSAFWGGLIDWLRSTLVAEGMIDASDLDLLTVVDAPEQVLESIFRFYDRRGFEVTAAEREQMVYL